MEKITINSIEAKFGKPNAQGVCTQFWGVQFTDGRKATIWDEQIAKTVESKLNVEIEVELKTSPSGYINIRAVNMESAQKNKAQEDINRPTMEKMENKPSRKDSIVAQVFVKCATELMKGTEHSEIQDVGERLCAIVVELHGAYKVALDRLNE